MKRIIKFCITSCLFLSISCNNEEKDINIQTVSQNDFKKNIKLYGERKQTKEILNVRNFFIKDSFLVINNSREDSIFMVFNLNTFECIKSWGLRGNGPAEYGVFTHLLNIPSQKKMQIADFSRYRIETYNVPEFNLIGKQTVLINQPPEKRQIPQNIVSSNENTYFYNNLFANKISINRLEKGKPPSVINNFDHYEVNYEDPIYYTGSLVINNDENKIVYAYRYKRRFDIFDFEGNFIKAVKVTPKGRTPRKLLYNMFFSSIHYIGARASSDSFFLLYIGHSPKYIEENEFLVTCYIEEYDWDGNPIKRYELNRYINDFDIVFEKNKSISYIGIDINDENPLIKFKEN